jgi:hypothetical protein
MMKKTLQVTTMSQAKSKNNTKLEMKQQISLLHHSKTQVFNYFLSCCFESGLRGLTPLVGNLISLAIGLLGPLVPDRGLCSVVNSPTRELKERCGLSRHWGSFLGVGVELLIFGLEVVCLNSPRLLVRTSSNISPSPIWEAPAPNSDCC